MSLIHHLVAGRGRPSFVFIHGFACDCDDWDAQVEYFSQRHQTIAVSLRGHGASPGTADECSIERFGQDVADVMQALDLVPSVLVGHSMGCRVAIEAALRAPNQSAAVVLLDGSQFAGAMRSTLAEAFAASDGYTALTRKWFEDMFTPKSDRARAAAIIEHAARLPREIGEKVLLDMVRYDVDRLIPSLASLRVPVLAIQSTYSNERRERRSMTAGQTTPYLDRLRQRVPSAHIEVIPATGHFPQIDEAARTNVLIETFVAALPSN